MYGTSSVIQRLNTSSFSLPTFRGPSTGFDAGGVFDGVWPAVIDTNAAKNVKTMIDVRLIINIPTGLWIVVKLRNVVSFVQSIDERAKRKVGRVSKLHPSNLSFTDCEPGLLCDRKFAL